MMHGEVSREFMNRLVMDYLVIEGHKEAAECFEAESGTSAGLNLETIVDRRSIRTAVEAGNVSKAIEHAQKLYPALLSESPDLAFALHQQQLIELIRADKVLEAIEFAQAELGPKAEVSPPLMTELERTMMLLAYSDLQACPEAELLSQAQRQRTASKLNAALLSALKQETEAALPMLFRRLLWEHDSLQQRQQRQLPGINFDAWTSCGATATTTAPETGRQDNDAMET